MDVSLEHNVGLVHWLIQKKIIPEINIKNLLSECQRDNTSILKHIIALYQLDAEFIAKQSAEDFSLSYIELKNIDLQIIPRYWLQDILLKERFLPVSFHSNILTIVTDDATKLTVINKIEFELDVRCQLVIADAYRFEKLFIKVLNSQKENNLAQENNLDIHKENKIETDDTIVIDFVNNLITLALEKKSSDIHLEPYQKNYRIRYRIDGILYEMPSPDLQLSHQIGSRIKILSKLDISQKRLPQDGQMQFHYNNISCDIRVSTIPTIHGEKFVLRLLDNIHHDISLENLGFSSHQKNIFIEEIKKPHGLILVTGPTGSGKTVTLYSAMQYLNHSQVNIATVEDPVEIHLDGINQINIHHKIGLTFATSLRALLRQDPDIIMIGEMRDLETAEIAIKSAQTGHLVFSTIHTNNAVETLTRLQHLGLSRYNLATTITLIIAQRLARKLCDHCKILEKIPDDVLKEEEYHYQFNNDIFYKANGCDSCTDGYSGRIGIFEMLPVSNEISSAILGNKSPMEILSIAKTNHMETLKENAFKKVQDGLTSYAEINRVIKI